MHIFSVHLHWFFYIINQMESTSIRFVFLTYSTFLALLSFLLTHSVRRRVLNEFFTGYISKYYLYKCFTKKSVSNCFWFLASMNLKLRNMIFSKCVFGREIHLEQFKFKGLSFKPSGILHCCPDFLFFEIETSNFGYLLIFKCFRKIGQTWYKHFKRVPTHPFEFWVD